MKREVQRLEKKVLKPPEGELGFVKLLLVSSLITLSPGPFRCVGFSYMHSPASR